MKRILLAWAMALLIGSSARAEEPVYFASAGLQAAVEEALGIPNPTPTDMLGLTSLSAPDRLITDLTGLEYATHLRTLRLLHNNITSIWALAGMTQMEELVLNNNQIGDLSPVAGMTKLRVLDVHDNHFVASVTPLAALTELERLVLRGNRITSVAPLVGLTKLRYLYLEDNRISDIAPLLDLPPLELLNLEDNPLNEDACSTYIPELWARNPAMSLRYNTCGTCRLLISSTTGGSVIRPGEGEFSYRSGEGLWLEAQADPCYVFEKWSGSILVQTNPLWLTLFSNLQVRAYFRSTRDTLYVDDDAPHDPGPGDPACSDPAEDGTAEHPFDRIQEAIDVAGKDVSILIHPGTYRENIEARNWSIRLIGTDPDRPDGGPCALIEAAEAGPVVQMSGSGSTSGLTGLIIARGRDATAAAILCRDTAVNITRCLIVGHRTTDPNGAALYATDSQIAVTNCTLADNCGGAGSAALTLVRSRLTMTNSILWNDTSDQVLVLGTSEADIRYCAVRGWWPDVGNLHADPLFARRGNWVDPENALQVLDPQDPRAIWSAGDYHLQSQAGRWDPQAQAWTQDEVSSPCIDAGDPTGSAGAEPEPNGQRINLGVYGGTGEASKSPISASP